MKTQLIEIAEALSPEALLCKALPECAGPACLTCSFQAEDLVVLHIVLQHLPRIPVLFLDTGYHFPETYLYRDRVASAWNLNLVNIKPKLSVQAQEGAFGILHRVDPSRCCHLRKVEPLIEELKDFRIWFTGLRREQSSSRKNLNKIEQHQLPAGELLFKINLLADWQWPQVRQYLADHAIEAHPLYEQGYTSIGCEPCTSIPINAENPRSGRWGGQKLECGIHTFSKGEE